MALTRISPTNCGPYRGRTFDVFIVQYCGCLDFLEPGDQVMTDLGLKIKTNLALKQCTLYISPSATKRNQMTSTDVKTA